MVTMSGLMKNIPWTGGKNQMKLARAWVLYHKEPPHSDMSDDIIALANVVIGKINQMNHGVVRGLYSLTRIFGKERYSVGKGSALRVHRVFSFGTFSMGQ